MPNSSALSDKALPKSNQQAGFQVKFFFIELWPNKLIIIIMNKKVTIKQRFVKPNTKSIGNLFNFFHRMKIITSKYFNTKKRIYKSTALFFSKKIHYRVAFVCVCHECVKRFMTSSLEVVTGWIVAESGCRWTWRRSRTAQTTSAARSGRTLPGPGLCVPEITRRYSIKWEKQTI